jgi:hypothetical protein
LRKTARQGKTAEKQKKAIIRKTAVLGQNSQPEKRTSEAQEPKERVLLRKNNLRMGKQPN